MKTKLFFTLFLCIIALKAVAQPGTIDTTFNSTDIGFGAGDGTNGGISATAITSNGKIIIGGSFTTYNGNAAKGIVQLNADGLIDNTFNSGSGVNVNGTINSISIQTDGKIIISGDFTTYNGVPVNRIARLNSNGSLDSFFNCSANGTVLVTNVQGDGKIIVGGLFTTINGISENYLVRLNSDGSIDNTFVLEGTGINGFIKTVSIQSDGKIIAGGNFTLYDIISKNRLVRLNSDGSIDNTFNIGTGFNVAIYTTSIQSDGKIIVGGLFTSYNSITKRRIVRLNSDGSIDNTFNIGTGFGNNIYTTHIQSNGKIIVGGYFGTYNSILKNHIVRLNSDGSIDNTFIGLGFNNGGSVNCTAIQSDGKIIVGGGFNSYNGTPINNIIRLNTDGTNDNIFNFQYGSNASVSTTCIQSDGKILIAGSFSSFNGTIQSSVDRLNTDGTIDSSFNTSGLIGGTVNSFSLQNDSKIIIGGNFTINNGNATINIGRLNNDGTLDSAFNVGVGTNSSVLTTAIQADGKIIIGGTFSSYNGYARNYLVRVNPDGSFDSSFNLGGAGASGIVRDCKIQNDGKIIIVGSFDTYNGILVGGMVRLNNDGSINTVRPIAQSNTTFNNISIQNDGKILSELNRFNSDLTDDNTFDQNIFNNLIYNGFSVIFNRTSNIILQSDGKIIVAGKQSPAPGITYPGKIVRLNSNGTIDSTFNQGLTNPNNIYSLSIQNDGKIIIGGDFTSYNGTGRNRIARINGGTSLATPAFEKENIVIYPNPIQDILHVDIDKEFSGTLYDITGKTLMNINSKDIDLSSLSAGIYILDILSEGKRYTKKIIKE